MDAEAPRFGLRVRTGTEETEEGEFYVVAQLNDDDPLRLDGPFEDEKLAELGALSKAGDIKAWLLKQGTDPRPTEEIVKRFGSEFVRTTS